MSNTTIDSLLNEDRRFPPSASFVANAIAQPEIYKAASSDRLGFWADQARALHWHKPFTQTLDWSDAPFAKWFADGEINVAYNCLDRHIEAGLGDRVAIQFEGEPGDSRTITYRELTDEVRKAANLLASLGVSQGDRVAIYMPLIPEAVIAMLACARVGAIHSVVFGGFAAESLRARIDDAEAKLVITHGSTANNFTVAYNKPVLVVTSDDLNISNKGPIINATAEHLGASLANLDRPRQLDASELLRIDTEKYALFRTRVIKRPGSPQKSTWQTFCEHLRMLRL